MLLGHWYLVAPGLSIRYLKIVTIGLILALLIRSGVDSGLVLTAGSDCTTCIFTRCTASSFCSGSCSGCFDS